MTLEGLAEEIIQKEPGVNSPDDLDDYSQEDGYLRSVEEEIERLQITPVKFPRVVDLFAGTGSVAQLLEKRGWKSENIICFDINKPTQFRAGSQYRYWDLRKLAFCVLTKIEIPPEVEEWKQKFDFAIALQSHEEGRYLEALGRFFLKKGGVYFPDQEDIDQKNVWVGYKGSRFFLQKK